MSGVNVTIELPESDEPGELIKGYFTLMRSFGWDLALTTHERLNPTLGKGWFAARISELKQSDPKNWHPNHTFEPQDPGVILKDYIHEQDSPYLNVFGGDWKKQAAAKKILGTRNTWFHFGSDPVLGQLTEAAKTVKGFVITNDMHIAGRIDKLVARLDDLSTGRYPTAKVVTAAPTVTTPESEPVMELPQDFPRPHIGGTWLGPIPSHRYRLTKANDVIDPDTMESVKPRVVGDAAEKLRAWTAVEPRGRELWIDADGAVGGFIGASPRLLGYLGPDPEGETARVFFTPHFYAVDGMDFIDLDTGGRLMSDVAGNLKKGASLRVTTYGDLLLIDEDHGVARVATVSPSDWFPGHLD